MCSGSNKYKHSFYLSLLHICNRNSSLLVFFPFPFLSPSCTYLNQQCQPLISPHLFISSPPPPISYAHIPHPHHLICSNPRVRLIIKIVTSTLSILSLHSSPTAPWQKHQSIKTASLGTSLREILYDDTKSVSSVFRFSPCSAFFVEMLPFSNSIFFLFSFDIFCSVLFS